MLPTASELTQATVLVSAVLVGASKLVSLWGKAKSEVSDSHEKRFSNSWERVNEMLDDCQAENERLRAERNTFWTQPETDRRRQPRERKPDDYNR